jgi:hypothetical protein
VELASASSQSNPNASQKTGLTIQIRNGWRDFRFREKFLEREEIGKRFHVENAGFRVVWERERRTKLSLLRLDSGVERGTCTDERVETWRQNAQKGGEKGRKEAGRVGTADNGREEREGVRGEREG